MKTMRWITVLLCLLLLAGCAENEAQPQDAVAETEIVEKTDLYELTRTEWMYTAKMFDRQGNVLYTCGPYPKQPRITEISDGLIKVSTQGGTGLSTQTSVFCNADTGAVSDRLTWVLAQTENIVVCGKKDELLIRDIFGYLDGSEPRFAYCVSYDRFADIADNVIEPVRAARFTKDGTALEVEYVTNNDYQTKTATVPFPKAELVEKTAFYEVWDRGGGGGGANSYLCVFFDRDGGFLKEDVIPRYSPNISETEDGLLKVRYSEGTGLTSSYVYYYDTASYVFSQRFRWPLGEGHGKVICGSDEEITVQPIFGGGEEVVIPYDRLADIAAMDEPVLSACFTEDGTALEVMYYAQKGSERVESTATVPLTDGTRQAIPTAVDATVQRTALTMDFVPPIAYTYDTLAAASDVVAVADVQDIADGDGSIVTACRTVDVLKGTVPETFWVADSGVIREADREGYEDLNEVRTECTMLAEPLMRRGNRVLLFLVDEGKVCEDGTPCYPLAVGPASKFFFDPTTSRYDNALWYSEVYQEQYEDGTVAVRYLMDTAPKTLEQIKERIRSNEE